MFKSKMVAPAGASSIAFTVRLTPSMVIEPLAAMYLDNSAGALILKRTERASSLRLKIVPKPST